MCPIDVFTKNLFSFARMLGSKFGGGILSGPSGSVAAASGLPYAGENYLILLPSASSFEAERLIAFFHARSLDYVAPMLPKIPLKLVSTLEAANVLPVHTYFAMSFDLTQGERERTNNLVCVQNTAAAEEWGRVVWEGFDGNGEAPVEYLSLARHLADHPANKLYLLREGNVSVSCSLLHCTEDTCGLYYFATPPSFRRRGNAKKLMNALTSEAAYKYKSIILLATPEGYPFYDTFGFKTLENIPMRSNSREL